MNKNKISTADLLNTIKTICPNAIVFDGLNDCIVGVNISLPNKTNVVYSKLLILNKLMLDGYEIFDAINFYETNITSKKFDLSVEPYFIEEYKFDINYN